MTSALFLEDFGAGDATPAVGNAASPAASGMTNDEDRLAVYENGYQSGWDDCAAAEAESHRRIGADLSANLQELTLTYAEARQDVLTSLGPLFEDMAAQLLPALAAEAIAPAVIAELQDAARETTDGTATLIASPAAVPVLERLTEAQGGLEIKIRSEPAYAEGQVSIRFGGERRDIDLGDAADRMAAAIRAFVEDAAQTPQQTDQGVA